MGLKCVGTVLGLFNGTDASITKMCVHTTVNTLPRSLCKRVKVRYARVTMRSWCAKTSAVGGTSGLGSARFGGNHQKSITAAPRAGTARAHQTSTGIAKWNPERRRKARGGVQRGGGATAKEGGQFQSRGAAGGRVQPPIAPEEACKLGARARRGERAITCMRRSSRCVFACPVVLGVARVRTWFSFMQEVNLRFCSWHPRGAAAAAAGAPSAFWCTWLTSRGPAMASTARWAMAEPVPNAMPDITVPARPLSRPPPPCCCCCIGAGACDC